MRSAQKSNRSRGRGNRKGGGGNNINRVYDSAGPEGKVRGTPQQIIDKYLSLARDAQTSGDRVTAENFLQHAEHYQRILITATAAQEQNRREQAEQQQQNQDNAAKQAGEGEQPATPEPAQAAQPAQPAQPSAEGGSEIGGMAMIDAGSEPDTLIVDAADADKPAPRRNGDGRRRRPKKEASEPADQPEASSEL